MQNVLNGSLGGKMKIFILQLSAVTLIVISLSAARVIGADAYKEIIEWYKYHFMGETRVSEVLADEKKEENSQAAEQTQNISGGNVINVSAVQTVRAVNAFKEQSSISSNSFQKPLSSYRITSNFGDREHPILAESLKHKGIDLAAPSGTEILAAQSGKIVFSGYSKTYGNYIIIEHSAELKTLYAHCSSLLKNSGDSAEKGEAIALVGSTGLSTGAHLHFEVILNGENINPAWIISW